MVFTLATEATVAMLAALATGDHKTHVAIVATMVGWLCAYSGTGATEFYR